MMLEMGVNRYAKSGTLIYIPSNKPDDPDDPSKPGDKGGMPDEPMTVGLIAAACVVIFMLIVLWCYCCYRCNQKKTENEANAIAYQNLQEDPETSGNETRGNSSSYTTVRQKTKSLTNLVN